LKETVDKFLPTALPLAKDEEEKNSLIKAADKFVSEAAELQKRLEQRREEMGDSSWLQLWWNTLGYLQVRDPVVVNVSYFFQFSDDGTLPYEQPSNKSLGVLRASSLLYSSAQYRKLVATGTLPHEAIGKAKTPLCSAAYKYMFNACRIPRKEQDTYRIYDPALNKHVIVACGGQFYSFDFVDENGDPLPLTVLEDRLQRCEELSKGGGSKLPFLGYLTSDDRDKGAEARDELIRIGGQKMEKALEILESGALLICLDANEEPTSKKQVSEIMWTGGLTCGHNRWHDKSIQIICTNNGKAGMAGEHSMMDGMPVVGYCDFITKKTYGELAAESASGQGHESAEKNVKNIFADCVADLHSSGSNAQALVDQCEYLFNLYIQISLSISLPNRCL
jgi:carnitine O-acetyltransferase